MADLSDLQAAQSTKIVGADSAGIETNPLGVKSNQEARTVDTCDTSAIDAVLNLTTGSTEGKVGGARLVNRKYVEFQALSTGVKWGYNTSCNFDIFKNQFLVLMHGDQPIYFKMSSGTGQVVFAEKS